jgi:glycerol kinase
VIDVGTSSVRAAVVRPDGTVDAVHRRPLPPSVPFPGLVEVDAVVLADTAIELAQAALAEAGPVAGVGVTNQRGTTIVWDATTGEPVGPGLSWQDLRTAGTCLELQAEGLRLAPNQSVTKLAHLLDEHDPQRRQDLRFGTVDSWIIWRLSLGSAHVTDSSNAGITGLLEEDQALSWDPARLERFRIPERCLPRLVPSSGVVGEARALPGAPPICGLAGDQQASLFGQGCIEPGDAKLTVGTGAFADVNLAGDRPDIVTRGPAGCFPIVAWRLGDTVTWGVEGIMLSAGSALQWLVEDLHLLDSAGESAEVAAACEDTGDVWYVPAQVGLGSPHWDYGARSLLIGMTNGAGRPQIVRAVLEGIAHRCADLLEAAGADAGRPLSRVRVDGGMSANPVLAQAIADSCQRPIELSAYADATTVGAGYLAGLAAGVWASPRQAADTVRPRATVEPRDGDLAGRRERWQEAVRRSTKWIPELSALDF